MASNIISDQQHLIADENDNPPTYQDATNQGKKICSNSIWLVAFNKDFIFFLVESLKFLLFIFLSYIFKKIKKLKINKKIITIFTKTITFENVHDMI